MKSEQINSQVNKGFSNTLLHGNCVELLTGIASGSADFVLTDPPYMVNYSSSDGRIVPNDDNDAWVKPAFESGEDCCPSISIPKRLGLWN